MLSISRGYQYILLLSLFLVGCQDKNPNSISHPLNLSAWLASIEQYGTQDLFEPSQYGYNWLDAVFLKAMIARHEATGEEKYYAYIRQCVDNTLEQANGNTPNDLAPAMGVAYLYQTTGDGRYLDKTTKVWRGYLRIERSAEGGVSHVYDDIQLWDDTLYMMGLFLQQMYLATGDDAYLEEYIEQLLLHAEKLYDPEVGLWYHGWDEDRDNKSAVGSLPDWPNAQTGRSEEFWGRGNGWILMSLVDALAITDQNHVRYPEMVNIYVAMAEALLPLQNATTGHWLQLPVHLQDKDNYPESSCTAMFCYAMAKGINLGILDRNRYLPIIEKGIAGLQTYSTQVVSAGYRQPINVCVGTGIGDKAYYYQRPTTSGLSFAMGAFLLAGYELQKLTEE